MPEAGFSQLLPDQYLITPSCRHDGIQTFLKHFDSALAAGIELVRLRPGALSEANLLTLFSACQALCDDHDATLLIGAELQVLLHQPVCGLHLNSQHLRQYGQRPADVGLLSASCHNGDEIDLAARLGVDFIVVSPVLATPSHPACSPMGWQGLGKLIRRAPMPVFALGGMSAADLPTVKQLGGQGVAAIRGLWPACVS